MDSVFVVVGGNGEGFNWTPVWTLAGVALGIAGTLISQWMQPYIGRKQRQQRRQERELISEWLEANQSILDLNRMVSYYDFKVVEALNKLAFPALFAFATGVRFRTDGKLASKWDEVCTKATVVTNIISLKELDKVPPEKMDEVWKLYKEMSELVSKRLGAKRVDVLKEGQNG